MSLALGKSELAVAVDAADTQVGVSDQWVVAQTVGVATKTTVSMTDDLDPELAAEETVQFSLDGAGYEIDLTAEHAAQLRDQLAVYVAYARKAGSSGPRTAARPTRSKVSSSASTDEPAGGDTGEVVDSKAVREWAKAQGRPVSERGRIASSLLVEFTEAHSH